MVVVVVAVAVAVVAVAAAAAAAAVVVVVVVVVLIAVVARAQIVDPSMIHELPIRDETEEERRKREVQEERIWVKRWIQQWGWEEYRAGARKRKKRAEEEARRVEVERGEVRASMQGLDLEWMERVWWEEDERMRKVMEKQEHQERWATSAKMAGAMQRWGQMFGDGKRNVWRRRTRRRAM